MENLPGYAGNVWQFALCTFNLRHQPTKRERVLENTKLWKTFAYICLLCVQDDNQNDNVVKPSLFIYILFVLTFQLLILT